MKVAALSALACAVMLERELQTLERLWAKLDPDPYKASRRKLAVYRFRQRYQQALLLAENEEAAREKLDEAFRELLRWNELESVPAGR